MVASPLPRNKQAKEHRNSLENMTSALRVLGCSGGIGSQLRTTSFLLDDDILIDAGTGVGDLSLDELRKINRVFLTHSHLDHICSIPFMADAVGSSRTKPLQVFGIKPTIDALRNHILNNVIWPNFTEIPSKEQPFITLHEINIHQVIDLGNQGSIAALPVNHSIPANAYAITTDTGALVFTGDTGPCDALWEHINQLKNLRHLIIETSFNDHEEKLAKISGHLSPQLLMQELAKLKQTEAQVWITHLKPDGDLSIMEEISNNNRSDLIINAIERDQVIEF